MGRKRMNETTGNTTSRPSRRRRSAVWRRAAYGAMRLGLWAIAALFLVLFFNKVWHPYGLNRKLQRDLAQTRSEVQAVKDDNERQERRIKYLKTREGASAEARRLGYHFKGEIPLRIQEPTPPPAAPSTK